VVFEPGCCLETLGEIFAGVTFLLQVGNEEFGDCRVIIDEEELDSIAGKDFHRWLSLAL
jgi:hypothetical protein